MTTKLHHYQNLWRLSRPYAIASTFSSTIYKVRKADQTLALKILKPAGIKDEKQGADALRYYNGQGAVNLIEADEGAHLLEFIPGDNLLPMVKRDGDIEATRIIGEVLNKLHEPRETPVPETLISLRRRFQALFRQASDDKLAGRNSLARRAAPIAEALLATAREQCVLHGDMHHENVGHHPTRGWLAFDPKGLYGERTFDAANTLCNPVSMPQLVRDAARLLRNADILTETMQLDRSRLLHFTFAYACLSAVWSEEDGQDGRLALSIATLLEKHL